MQTVGIKDLKNSLSRYLAFVKNGEEIIVTERGKPIARIIAEKPAEISIHESLKPLIMKGGVAMPTKAIRKEAAPLGKLSGKPVSEMVVEDRR